MRAEAAAEAKDVQATPNPLPRIPHPHLIHTNCCADCYTRDEAAAEAEDVQATRLQALVYCLDKAKVFLRHQPPELRERPPLRLLTDAEAAEYLWGGTESVARRAVQAVQAYAKAQVSGCVEGQRAKQPQSPSSQNTPIGKTQATILRSSPFSQAGKL